GTKPGSACCEPPATASHTCTFLRLARVYVLHFGRESAEHHAEAAGGDREKDQGRRRRARRLHQRFAGREARGTGRRGRRVSGRPPPRAGVARPGLAPRRTSAFAPSGLRRGRVVTTERVF